MPNDEKMIKYTWNILGVNIAVFLKYVWPFFNIPHESVNGKTILQKF